MNMELNDMSIEELWQLFPIFLTEHKLFWKDWYYEEEAKLRNILVHNNIKRISHIGSTSIDTIWAKPIIDILIEIPKDSYMRQIKHILLSHDYLSMSEDSDRISFNKGYTKMGFSEKVYHIHLRYCGDNDELYFRDYLIEYPDTAKEYETLKINLWKKFEHDRDGYTNHKSDFIIKYTKEAKIRYAKRYSG